MLQISFDNLSKRQKILEEDTLYSLYQANQKYEELKKYINETSEGQKIDLPDITLADEHNVALLEINDLSKESIHESLASLLTKAIVIENQLEEENEQKVAFERRVTNEINTEIIDKHTGKPKPKERKETALNKTVRTTGKGKKWVLNLFNKEKTTPEIPESLDSELSISRDMGNSSEEETESTIDRLLKGNDLNNSETDQASNVEHKDKESVADRKDLNQIENVSTNETNTLQTGQLESAATNEFVATRTENKEAIIETEPEKIEPVIESKKEPVLEDMFISGIRDSLEVLKTALENPNLTTTERELLLYKIDKFNSLSIESQTLVAKHSENYNATFTEKELNIEKRLKEELANLLATFNKERTVKENKIIEKYIEIEKTEKEEYLNSNDEKEAQIVLEENYNQKVKEAKEHQNRQNEIRTNSFLSTIKNTVKDRKNTELENVESYYENLISEKSIELRHKYEDEFNADMDKFNLDLLTEKKEFLTRELKNIEETVLNNLSNWHELATKELNNKHENLTLEKEKIELEIERTQSISRSEKEKEDFKLEIVKLKKEVEEKSLKEAQYVANEEKRLEQNQVSINLQTKMIEELQNKKSFMNEVDIKVEETINKSLLEEKKKNERMKYVMYSTIGLTIVSLGLAVYGLSSRDTVEGSIPVSEEPIEDVDVLSNIEAEAEPEPEPEILSLEEYLEGKGYEIAIENYPDNLDQIEDSIYSNKDLDYLKEFVSEYSTITGKIDVAFLEDNNEKIIEEYNDIDKKEELSKGKLERIVRAFEETDNEDEAKKVEELLEE